MVAISNLNAPVPFKWRGICQNLFFENKLPRSKYSYFFISKIRGRGATPTILLLLSSLPWAGLLRKKGHVAEHKVFIWNLDETKSNRRTKLGASEFQALDATKSNQFESTYLLWICKNAEKVQGVTFSESGGSVVNRDGRHTTLIQLNGFCPQIILKIATYFFKQITILTW